MKLKGTPVRLLEGESSRRRQASRRKDYSRSPAHPVSSVRISSEFNPNLYISSHLQQEDILGIKEAFDTYDSNGTGLLTPNDLKVALFHQGFHASKETIYNIIAEYDQDCLGGVNFAAFMKIITNEPTENEGEHDIKRVFRKMDRDNKGYLDRKDLTNLLKNLGQQWQQSDLDVIFDKLDENQGNKISYELFKKIMHSPFSMY